LSQIINYIEVTDENGNTTHVDGQALMLASLDFERRLPEACYQAWVPTVTGATGVAAVGQYSMYGPFAGTVFSIVVGLNAATATGYTAPSAAAYVVTCAAVEAPYDIIYLPDPSGKKDSSGNPVLVGYVQPVKRHKLNGRFVVNSQYTGKMACHNALVGIDNAELSTKVSSVKVGGNTFSAQECQMAEDSFDAFIGGSTTMSTAFAGNATVPPKNVQTGNALGLGEFGGPVDAVVEIALTSVQTMIILERVPI